MTDEILTPPPIGPFFRFPDEATWLTAARDAGFLVTVTDEDGNDTEQLAAYTKDHAIDVVGTITRGGEWDDEGNTVVPPTALPGWHINYQGELPEGWEQYAVQPLQPVRVWA